MRSHRSARTRGQRSSARPSSPQSCKAPAASADEARTIARRLVDSNLVGHDSHGVIRVGKYLEWVRAGWLEPNTAPSIVFESDAIAIVDGNRGFGQVVGEFATRLGIAQGGEDRASRWSACAIAAIWAASATGPSSRPRQGQVSLHFLNTSGAQRVAPFGGSDRRLSTNPITIGVPAGRRRSGRSST